MDGSVVNVVVLPPLCAATSAHLNSATLKRPLKGPVTLDLVEGRAPLMLSAALNGND